MLASFEYDGFDRRSLLLRGNGRRTLYEYDRASRLSALVNTSFGSAADVRFEYTYNPASQIVTRWSSNDSYAWIGHFNENKAGTANGLNQLTQVGAKSLSHDTRGNVTAFGAKSFTYDSENMMKSGPNGTMLSYDPAMRLQQVTSGASTRLAYDGLDRILEADGANAIQRRYVFGPGIDEPLVWYEGSGTGDRRFLEADERGSVILAADTAGATLATNRYDEYGQPQSTNLGSFGYTGQAWLPTIGQWYYKARNYDPELGRFLQTDPIGYGGGMSNYAYVGNDPVNWSDPLGLYRVCETFDATREEPDGTIVVDSIVVCYENGKQLPVTDVTVRDFVFDFSGIDESFFRIIEGEIETFDPDFKVECKGSKTVTYGANPSSFKGGLGGHLHTHSFEPNLGADDGMAARASNHRKFYMASPAGRFRVEVNPKGQFSAALISGSWGMTENAVKSLIGRWNKFGGQSNKKPASQGGDGGSQCKRTNL